MNQGSLRRVCRDLGLKLVYQVVYPVLVYPVRQISKHASGCHSWFEIAHDGLPSLLKLLIHPFVHGIPKDTHVLKCQIS